MFIIRKRYKYKAYKSAPKTNFIKEVIRFNAVNTWVSIVEQWGGGHSRADTGVVVIRVVEIEVPILG